MAGGSSAPRWFQLVEESREWEDFYRGRWRFDKVVRSTHGVNCSMSCSWLVYVKDGIVTWELQAIDYPLISSEVPPHEPRGCQRGISSSWYLYSPLRVKYPYVRGVLWEMFSEARRRGLDPVEAWASIVEDGEKAVRYKRARGKGGWKRVTWGEALELIAGAVVYTLKKYGPDRIAAFSPIPAMSMVSFSSGIRFVNLLGGVTLSFYEWYNDLPLASPQVYGEQTDVHESADWYNATYWIIAGTSLPTTRTADAHFMSEVRYNGTKVVIVSPDYYDHVKFADVWVPIKAGTDTAFALAMAHVVLKEFYVDRAVDYFIEYAKKYTNLPFLVVLERRGDLYVPGRMLRASQVAEYSREEYAEWKLLVLDSKTLKLKLPKGSIGFRWESGQGRWNLKLEDAVTGEPIDPLLTLIDIMDEAVPVAFPNFDDTFKVDPEGWGTVGEPKYIVREVPVKRIKTVAGEVLVTTVLDLLMAHMGVPRKGLRGDYPASYDDPKPYTPAWQERFTGVDRGLVIKIAREFAENAEKTRGKSLIILGPGVQHWYHQDLAYRAYILLVILTGCVGRNGGGWCHYVGTEKLRTLAPVVNIAFALDWVGPPRLMNSTLYWYIHTAQWKYDRMTLDTQWAPYASERVKRYRHPADFFAMAVRSGWIPFYPTFNRSTLEIVREAINAGAKTDKEIVDYVVRQLKEGRLRFAIEDPDAPENSPKVLFVWRGNLIGTSMRGHYHFLKTMLGTHHNILGEEQARDLVREIRWREPTPEGKLDLLVTIEFRMSSSANYADVVLPAAHWYEKYDLTCGDLHTFVHPFTPATDPYWESRHEWEIFRDLARKVSELASKHLPGPVKDLVVHAFLHDTPQELAQPWGDIADWKYGDAEPVPGKTLPVMVVVERDYTKVYDMYIRLGPRVRERFGAKGIFFPLGDLYDRLKEEPLIGEVDGYPSLETPVAVAETILRLAPETDGEVSYRAWKALEARTGLRLADLVEHRKDEKFGFNDLVAQPRRVMSSPMWSGIEAPGRTYSPYTLNVERLVPWRTLSGRQEVYIDHGVFRSFGEALPTFKPPVDHVAIGDLPKDLAPGSKLFRFITPHPKWGIHSTFQDNLRMLALFRGGPHAYINPEDAKELGVKDNDWIEVYSSHGITVCRAVTSPRVPRGIIIMYHGQERNVNVPVSKLAVERGKSDVLGGNNNAPTRILPKVLWVVGGYAQLSYFLNYHGTSPSERDMIVAVRKMPLKPGEKPIYPAPGRPVVVKR